MILDTSVLVDIDRGVDSVVVERLDKLSPHIISAVTTAEFYSGVNMRDKKDEAGAERILSNAREVPLAKEIAKKAGELIARKYIEDLSIGLNDIYIAATAVEKGEPVLTSDKDDFEQIKELEVIDWEEFKEEEKSIVYGAKKSKSQN